MDCRIRYRVLDTGKRILLDHLAADPAKEKQHRVDPETELLADLRHTQTDQLAGVNVIQGAQTFGLQGGEFDLAG